MSQLMIYKCVKINYKLGQISFKLNNGSKQLIKTSWKKIKSYVEQYMLILKERKQIVSQLRYRIINL